MLGAQRESHPRVAFLVRKTGQSTPAPPAHLYSKKPLPLLRPR